MKRVSLARNALRCAAILVGAGLAPLGFADQPAGPLPEERSQAAVASAYSNKLICKRQRQTGSHIPKSVCRTQAQIDADHEAAEEFLRESNRQQGLRLPTSEQLPPVFN